MTNDAQQVTDAGLLPEDTDERRMFNDITETLGHPLLVIANALQVMARTAPPHGSYGKMMAIYSNECVKAARSPAPAADGEVALALRRIAGEAERDHPSIIKMRLGEAADLIRRLVAERDETQTEVAQLHGAANRLQVLAKEYVALRAALKPFADYADPTGRVPPDLSISAGSHMARRQLRMSDCYAAKAAHEQSAIDTPNEADMRAFGASDAACYKWPDDTPEHKALRAAYIEGAAGLRALERAGRSREVIDGPGGSSEQRGENGGECEASK